MNELQFTPVSTTDTPIEQIKRNGRFFFLLLFASILCQFLYSFIYDPFYYFIFLKEYGVSFDSSITQTLLDWARTLVFFTAPLLLILAGFWMKNKLLALIGAGTHAFFGLISLCSSANDLIYLL